MDERIVERYNLMLLEILSFCEEALKIKGLTGRDVALGITSCFDRWSWAPTADLDDPCITDPGDQDE